MHTLSWLLLATFTILWASAPDHATATTVTYEYDQQGRLTKAAYYGIGEIRYTYDAASNLLSRVVVGQVATAIESEKVVPVEFGLEPGYPNPFNAETVIRYTIDEPGPVDLVVFDLLGRPVRRLANAQHVPGSYSVKWDARDGDGRKVSTGVYVVRLRAGDKHESYKATLLK